MNWRVIQAPSNTARIVGFDTTETPPDADAWQRLWDAGLRFAVLYVNHVTAAQIDAGASVGFGIMFCAYARTVGWDAATGASDGAFARGKLRALGVPDDAALWADLEGDFPDAASCIAYANGWHAVAGDVGGYIGEGVPLSSGELFHALSFRAYWRSLSQVPNVERRGYQLIQTYPDNQIVAGTKVDLTIVQSDYLGGRPHWLIAA